MSRRPGISFETAVPPLPETFPRMDVAAFIGFATRGPMDVPVPVEDMVRFRDVFGPPLELVRDVETGRTRTAHLDQSVAAFFRNGGRRCWIVRVANPAPRARRSSFGLPGLVSAETGRPSTVQARCYGATFDPLRVGTVLHRHLLPVPSSVGRAGEDAPEHAFTISWNTARRHPLVEDELTQGDLLRLQLDSAAGEIVAFATVASLTRIEQNDDSGLNGRSLKVDTDSAYLFERSPTPLSIPEAGDAETTDEIEVDVTIEMQAPSGPVGSSRDGVLRRTTGGEDEPVFRIIVELDEESDGEGQGISSLENQVVHVHSNNIVGWLQLGLVSRSAGNNRVEIEVRDGLWPILPDEVLAASGVPAVDSVERLQFDLLTWENRELQVRLNRLGFAETHPRGWTTLPTDDDLFQLHEGEVVKPAAGTLRAEVFDPRFPFASSDAPGDGPFIPLGMVDRPEPECTRGRIVPPQDPPRLERELLQDFSTDIFVDRDFAGISTANLAEEADRKVYIEEQPAFGLHSLWPVREVALLAVPDAVHRGWSAPRQLTPTPASTPYLPAPVVDREAETPRVQLSWTVDRLAEDDVQVEVEEATEPTFNTPIILYRGSNSSVDRFVRSDVPGSLYFRFRIVTRNVPGAWSNTRRVDVPAPDFDSCTGRPGVVDADVVDMAWLRWEPLENPAEGDIEYEIQIDSTPTFGAPSTDVIAADQLPLTPVPPDSDVVPGPIDYHWYDVMPGPTTPAVRYARLRARRRSGSHLLYGGWSRTVAIVRVLQEMSIVSTAEYDDPEPGTPGSGREGLMAVQKAMLRFCAARGDALSVVTLPEHDQPEDVRRHVTRLRTPGTGVGYDEGQTLSYGALYYPWLLGPVDEREHLAPTPPDGAASGMIADRTLQDGAWAAPANISLAAVRVTVPPLSLSERSDLERHNVNVFGPEAGGVVTLGTATLARDPDLELITTRRLLILVRRLVRREAPRLVFEMNNVHLRRRIAEQFDQVLRRLFRRGAFAGATPPEGYRVVADGTVNPPEAIERGRLIVELRIAPSRPLKFLTVRLVHRGGQAPTIAEFGPRAPA